MRKIIFLSAFILSLTSVNSLQAQTNTQTGFQALNSITTGTNNSAFGYRSMFSTTTGHYNVGVGSLALFSNVNGGTNIGIGYAALYSNTAGNSNIGIGAKALSSNTTGIGSIGIGEATLNSNSTGNYNVGIGFSALPSNSTGANNIALGYRVMNSNNTGSYNVASGYEALRTNTIGSHNIATGKDALRNNTSGQNNNASGNSSAYSNTTGNYNVANGYAALYSNTTGTLNVAIGGKALSTNQTGNYNVGIGTGSGPNTVALTNTTALGHNTMTTASNQVRLGNTAVTSIGGYAAWTNLSDGRFKKDIKENVVGLAFINKLRPVSYTVDNDKLDKFLGADKSEFYTKSTVKPYYQTGFIAQEVEALTEKTGFKTFNGVDKPKSDKDHYGIRYAEFVVPLVKAVQELSSNQEELLAKIAEQQKQIEALLSNKSANKSTSTINTKLAEGIELYQNNPNPFSVATEIKMVLPETVKDAQIIVYNMEGKQLKAFTVEGTGNTSVRIDANELDAGMYIYALIADGNVMATKQMILTK